MKTIALAALLVFCAVGARAAAPAATPATPSAAKPEVKGSTAPFVPASPSTIYTAEKVRDPFSPAAGGATSGRAYNMDDFNIHNLTLRGMMKDRRSDFALFTDNTYGASFILRSGRLFAPNGKPVPGVKGSMDLKKKSAHLETAEADVQIFTLGDQGID